MGEWHKVEPKPYSPCDNCQSGSCGITSEIRNGELWMKSDDCHETCERYREYWDNLGSNKPKKEHLFGDNIRDAYASITILIHSLSLLMASRGW